MKDIPEYLQRVASGEIPPSPIMELIGFGFTHVERGRAIVELDVGEQHTNPFGLVQGGLICDIADSAMGAAYHSTLEENESCTTLEIKVSYFKPAPKTKLLAEGRVIKQGRNIGFLECDVTDNEGNLIARATSTLLKNEPSTGKRK